MHLPQRWKRKWKAKSQARLFAKLVAIDAINRQGWPVGVREAIAQVTFYHLPDKRQRDGDNHLHMCKAYFDGLADAKVIVNDSGFTHRPVKFVVGTKRRIVIVVEAEAVEA